MLKAGLRAHFSADQLKILENVRIGIAGAGGLGSNVAMLLARCGIERMVLIDDDTVQPSNLNRQQFWPRHVGQKKITALGANLMELNGDMRLNLLDLHLSRGNLPQVLRESRIWVEALDSPEVKSLFVEEALKAGCFIVAASGLCGFGGIPMRTLKMGNLVVVGDFQSAHREGMPPLAPRVSQAAAMMADCVLEHVLKCPSGI